MGAGARSVGRGDAACLGPKPRGSREEVAHTGDAQPIGGACNRTGNSLALDNWSYYNTCRWVDNPRDLSPPDAGPSILPPPQTASMTPTPTSPLLTLKLVLAKKTLSRSLVPCKLVPPRVKFSIQHAWKDLIRSLARPENPRAGLGGT